VDLVIFAGLPASGKSTFFRARFAATHRHVSKDLMRNVRRKGPRQARLIEEVTADRAGPHHPCVFTPNSLNCRHS
jgi:predicted kinase